MQPMDRPMLVLMTARTSQHLHPRPSPLAAGTAVRILRPCPFSSRDRGENPPTVFLLVWTGTADQAMEVVRYHYADYKIVLLSHRKLREGGWKGQVRALRDLRGEALVFFFQSLGDLHEPLLLAWSGLLHHCRETAFAESSGRLQRFRRFDWLRLFPKTVFAALADGMTFALSWILLQLGCWAKPRPMSRPAAENFDLDVAYRSEERRV